MNLRIKHRASLDTVPMSRIGAHLVRMKEIRRAEWSLEDSRAMILFDVKDRALVEARFGPDFEIKEI